MEWRFIPLETVSAQWAMALEEILVEGVASGGPPTLRFWSWDPSAATIGRFQDVEQEVDLQFCHDHGIDVVRRMSGGGAVFHQLEGEFAYSVTAPEEMFPRDLVKAYKEILGGVIAGLGTLGLEAWVKDDNNLLVGDLKVSGNSQRRSRGVIQVHGTMLFYVDQEVMFSVLKARPGMEIGRATPSKHHPVVSLSELCGVKFTKAYESIRDALLEGTSYIATSWTEAELTHAEDLVSTKYGTDHWNLDL
jgi:lipoate-protein ligase A